MTDQVTEKKPDLKELAKTLSDAYYSVLQYSNLTEEKVRTPFLFKKKVIQMTHRLLRKKKKSHALDCKRLGSPCEIQHRFTTYLVYSTIPRYALIIER